MSLSTVDDVELKMIEAHERKVAEGAHENHVGAEGDFIKSLVFGGLDGIITTFAIVCAAVGAGLSNKTVIVMGLANLVADAISMGLGDALSEKAELEFQMREWKREMWEMDHCPDGEKQEMVDLYVQNGVEEKDAKLIIDTMSQYKEFFVKHMMVLELDMMAPSEDENPWAKGAVTFAAFMAFGSLPLVSFVIFSQMPGVDDDLLFGLTIFCTVIAIFALGAVKGRVSQANVFMSGLSMLFNGGLAACASYLIGWGLEVAVPE